MTKGTFTLVVLSLIICLGQICSCFSPTLLLGEGLSMLWETVKCPKSECCSDKYIYFNEDGLENDLMSKLHGQHLVRNTVLPALRGHFRAQNSRKKALVLSFHGWTGGGKNFVSKIIAENLYTKGLDSNFVHQFITTKHFPLESNINDYKIQLQEKIEKAVANCGRSLFIFDEIDKMPETLLDIITPYIDYYTKIDGLDYRQSVFIFLSNAGGNNITNFVNQWWKDGKEREDISLKDVEGLVSRSAFNEKGGMHKTGVIKKHLTDVFVPFLPLEKRHVKQCIKDDILERGHKVTERLLEKVANEMDYFPPDVKRFSKSGCKRVNKKVDLLIEFEKDN